MQSVNIHGKESSEFWNNGNFKVDVLFVVF